MFTLLWIKKKIVSLLLYQFFAEICILSAAFFIPLGHKDFFHDEK